MTSDPVTSPVPLGTRALSPSKIETLQCPHRYRQLYVLHQEPEGAEAVELAMGTLVHEVAATYVRHLRDKKRQTDQTALDEYAKGAWEQREHRIPAFMGSDYAGFMHQLSQVVFDPETIVDSELRLTFLADWTRTKWDDPQAMWGGMIDVLGIRGTGADATAYMRDWTTAALSGQFGAKKDLQLRHYGLLVARGWQLENVEITAHSLRTGATQVMNLDEADHAETESRLLSERARLESLLTMDDRFVWPAVPNSQCGICLLPCPEMSASLLRDVPLRLETREAAVNELRRLVLLDSRRKATLALLKGYCAFHGPVESNGMEAASRPMEVVSYPAVQVMEWLEAAGYDRELERALKVDKRGLYSLLKNNKQLKEKIEATAIKVTKERFSVKAVGRDEEGEES